MLKVSWVLYFVIVVFFELKLPLYIPLTLKYLTCSWSNRFELQVKFLFLLINYHDVILIRLLQNSAKSTWWIKIISLLLIKHRYELIISLNRWFHLLYYGSHWSIYRAILFNWFFTFNFIFDMGKLQELAIHRVIWIDAKLNLLIVLHLFIVIGVIFFEGITFLYLLIGEVKFILGRRHC